MMVLKPYDYARKKIVYCWLDEPLNEVAGRLAEENIGSIVVDDREGNHIGMLTDSMIFKTISIYTDISNLKIKDLKLERLVTAKIDADLGEITEKFRQITSGRIALVDNEGKIVGILKKKNLDRFARFEVGEKIIEQERYKR